MDYCVKRFIEETYQNPNIYYDYLLEKFFINYNDYSNWLNELDIRNKLFADLIIDSNCIATDDVIVESVLTKEYNVSNYLNNAMIIRCSNEFKVPEANVNNSKKASFCYICNGYYNDTLSRINQVLDQGSFNIGISSSKHKSFYKEICTYYKQLKNQLINAGYNINQYEETLHQDYKVYLLSYRAKRK